jgi:hypothetical protein
MDAPASKATAQVKRTSVASAGDQRCVAAAAPDSWALRSSGPGRGPPWSLAQCRARALPARLDARPHPGGAGHHPGAVRLRVAEPAWSQRHHQHHELNLPAPPFACGRASRHEITLGRPERERRIAGMLIARSFGIGEVAGTSGSRRAAAAWPPGFPTGSLRRPRQWVRSEPEGTSPRTSALPRCRH